LALQVQSADQRLDSWRPKWNRKDYLRYHTIRFRQKSVCDNLKERRIQRYKSWPDRRRDLSSV